MRRVSGWTFAAERLKMAVVVLGVVVVGMVFLEVNGGPGRIPAGGPGPEVDVRVQGVSDGVEVGITPHGFAWAGDHASAAPQTGGAQVFLDGRLLAELYSPKVVLQGVDPGVHRVRVVLVDRDHRPVGPPREATVSVP
ncbi:MAG TPA: hypothetical protein GX517_01370 [Alicyclobacillus sp.]|nr:hypothetical protein [Alicyclobacillus sp.]